MRSIRVRMQSVYKNYEWWNTRKIWIIELLLKNCANRNISNCNGETALALAEKEYSQNGLVEYKQMVDLLKAN